MTTIENKLDAFNPNSHALIQRRLNESTIGKSLSERQIDQGEKSQSLEKARHSSLISTSKRETVLHSNILGLKNDEMIINDNYNPSRNSFRHHVSLDQTGMTSQRQSVRLKVSRPQQEAVQSLLGFESGKKLLI